MTSTPSKTYYVYVVECADGTLYTGYTDDVERRVAVHNAGKGGSYTRAHRPVSLLVSWEFPTKSAALKAEYAFKRLSRAQKLARIAASESVREWDCVLYPFQPLPETGTAHNPTPSQKKLTSAD